MSARSLSGRRSGIILRYSNGEIRKIQGRLVCDIVPCDMRKCRGLLMFKTQAKLLWEKAPLVVPYFSRDILVVNAPGDGCTEQNHDTIKNYVYHPVSSVHGRH